MALSSFTIGIVQDRATDDLAANLDRAERLTREAAGRGAQIVCLKELFNSPYFCKSQRHERFGLAESIPGPTVERFQALARDLTIVLVVPIFEREAPGVYRNSAAVIDADGTLLGTYRKMHIPDDPLFNEKFYFTPGDGPVAGAADSTPGFRVWKTRYATIGVLICWDQWYPEAARITSLLGAEVLFYPTAIGWHPSERAEWGQAQVDAWQIMQRSHAIANGVYVAAPNRVGHEDEPGTDGITFFGRSFIADPFGRMVAEAGDTDDEVLVATCERQLIESTRQNWPFLRDRRIDAYGPILRRYLGA
ncbi:MAG: carbon-nitrogen hydrolase [Acidobacteriota bacterium]|jgi:N-carbamoylputrescine amidase|nr:MAG: acyltransferase [Acidobacteriota bacterium]